MGEMVTREEFNGIGRRTSKVELTVASMDSKVERNSEDIQKIFLISEKIETSINTGTVQMERKLNKAKWQILVMVCIPIVLFILNLMIPKKSWTQEHTHFQKPTQEKSIHRNSKKW